MVPGFSFYGCFDADRLARQGGSCFECNESYPAGGDRAAGSVSHCGFPNLGTSAPHKRARSGAKRSLARKP